MARSATFKWSNLTRDNLSKMMRGCGSNLIGKKLKIIDIQKILSKQLKTNLPVKVISDRDHNTKQGHIYIGGSYAGFNDIYGNQCITVLFSYNPFDRYLTLTRERFNRICRTTADTILHEIIHMRQLRSRQWKMIPGFQSFAQSNKQRKDQEYYGDPDEIDAHAFNIACVLYDMYGNENRIANHLNQDLTDNRFRKDVYRTYLTVFDHNHRHPVIKKLKKRIMYYVPYAELGKPFKTSDWLKN